MNDISSVKGKITNLNNRCDLENKSIFDILKSKNISYLDFFASLGLDTNLLNDTLINVLESLIRTPDTRIHFNPNMESLINDEIELFSSSLNLYFGFLQNKIKANYDKSTVDSEYTYVDTEYMAVSKNFENIQTIHFSASTICLNKNTSSRVVTLQNPLKKVEIKMEYSDTNTPCKRLKVTIKEDMLQSDLNNIFRVLYNFNYSLAYALLYFYPTSMKIIEHDFEMNNFINR